MIGKLRRKLIPLAIRQRIISSVVQVDANLIHLLPTWLWLRIREKIALVRCMDYERHPIYMSVDSELEYDVRLHSCRKEPATIKWIEQWLKPGDVLYDIGANVGAYSLVAFRFLNGQTKVYAFEPSFTTFPQLCKNIYLNGAGERITPFPVALSNQNSVTPFHYRDLIPGGALHALGIPVDQVGQPFQPIFTLPTLSYRLNDFVRWFGLPMPNHIKLDVDGTEYQVLEGAAAILGHPELHSVLLEFDEGSPQADQIAAILESNGLVLHSQRSGNRLYVR